MHSYIIKDCSPRGFSIIRDDGVSIPPAQTNMDCHDFLCEWRDGAVVTDEAGSTLPYSDAAVIALGLTPVAP